MSMNSITTKMLGDAGEHFALSQLTFAGKPATKMPDGWKGYDLAVESGTGLFRVSVKTRRETNKWKSGSWFIFDDRFECDWLVFVFWAKDRNFRSWIIPYDVALRNANKPTPKNKTPWVRDISWAKLNKTPLSNYEDNWRLERLET